jgi:hypothetical protein
MSLLLIPCLGAWGIRAHTVANLAAVEGIPQDGPAFLLAEKAYIGHLGTIPDTWMMRKRGNWCANAWRPGRDFCATWRTPRGSKALSRCRAWSHRPAPKPGQSEIQPGHRLGPSEVTFLATPGSDAEC